MTQIKQSLTHTRTHKHPHTNAHIFQSAWSEPVLTCQKQLLQVGKHSIKPFLKRLSANNCFLILN